MREISPVLYQNRYCSQEDFYIIVGGVANRRQGGSIRNIYKVKYPNVDEILESFLTVSYSDATVASGLNIWTMCAQGSVSKNVNALRNSVQTNGLTYTSNRNNLFLCLFFYK